MHIEDRLSTIEKKLDQIFGRLLTMNTIGENQSGIAGAGADPEVAPKVDKAIADATPAAPARGRGRPRKAETEVAPPAQTDSGTPGNGIIASTPTPAAPAFDPFALDGQPAAAVVQVRSLDEVRAALAVYQAYNSQADALKLFKDTTGVETMAKLVEASKTQPEVLSKLFKAAIPADKLALTDVRVVLVKLNERKAGAGMEVLTAFKAADITKLEEKDFVAAILAAHKVQ